MKILKQLCSFQTILFVSAIILSQASAKEVSTKVDVKPPRTLEELKQEVLDRTKRQIHPAFGLQIEDTVDALSLINSFDPDEWGAAWIAIGDRYMARAQKSSNDKAKALYRQAYIYYSFGRWPVTNSPKKKLAYEHSLIAYHKYVSYLTPPMEVIRIPFEEKEIIAYLRLPFNDRPVPIVLAVGGVDYWKEQIADEGLMFIPHGIAWLAVDMPGTGQSPVKVDVDSDRVFSRIIDYIHTRPDLDAKRIIIRGLSFGGYWANKLAYTESQRLLAVNSHGGPVHDYFQTEWQQQSLSTDEYLMDHVAAITGIYGVDTVEQLLSHGQRLSLLKLGLIDKPAPPMLLINGALDTQIPISDLMMMLTRGTPKEAWINPQAGHMGFNEEWHYRRVVTEIIIPWMQRMFSNSPNK